MSSPPSVAALAAAGALAASGAPATTELGTSSGTFVVSGTVRQRLVLTTAVLDRLPSHTIEVDFQSCSTIEHHVYTGPALLAVIELAGPSRTPPSRTTSSATPGRGDRGPAPTGRPLVDSSQLCHAIGVSAALGAASSSG